MSQSIEQGSRDLSRAEWQRSVGAVIFTQAADEVFAGEMSDMPDLNTTVAWAKRNQYMTGVDSFWYLAHDVVYSIFAKRLTERRPHVPTIAEPDVMEFTHFGSAFNSVTEVMDEALRTQAAFPLNTAQLISLKAAEQGIAGYEVTTYAQMAQMLRRSDFRDIVATSLLTSNGVWQNVSLDKGISDGAVTEESGADMIKNFYEALEFTADDTVVMGEPMQQRLYAALKEVNKAGLSRTGFMANRASSGCPARHLRPHFTDSEADTLKLDALSRAYGKESAELQSQRHQSVVEDGLDLTSTILERLDTYFPDGQVSTYSSSAQYPA